MIPSRDPVAEHLQTRTEAEIRWHIRSLPGTRIRLLRRPVTALCPELTPEQIDIACLRADRELATYRLALMLIEAMPADERRAREERASKQVTNWIATMKGRAPEPAKGVFEPVDEYSVTTVSTRPVT